VRLKLVIASLLITSLSLASVHAATPTPKASAKPTAKPTTKTTAKPATTKKATPTKKPVVKKKKKPVVKKTATPIPSPSPVWPPVKFTENKGVYAKIPTGKEILGLISAKVGLANDVQKCEKNACGAVIVAANYTCRWWEIKSTVLAPDANDPKKRVVLGSLRTTYGLLSPKTYANILLISDEPIYTPGVVDPATGLIGDPILRPGITVGNISAICHKADTDEKLPSNVYLPIR
jgi:hypothetical protein